jgi:serine/threonine protein kinase
MVMSDILKGDHPDKDKILREFVIFMATKVHPKGILHNDMSPGNVLISYSEASGYSFSLIDLNRIGIKKHISHKKGLYNLKKLTKRPLTLALFAEHYANVSHENPGRFAFSLIGRQLYSSWLRHARKRFLHFFKPHTKAAA